MSAELQRLIDEAGREIARQIATDVVIIEDEPLIALDLERLVTALGHRVVKIARTERQAIEAVKRARPGLILADIQLADGSSGLDAVNEILRTFSVPVIFVTAYPQRLLTGTRPEPTFLITKPFHPDNVKADHQPGPVLRHPRPTRAAAPCRRVRGLQSPASHTRWRGSRCALQFLLLCNEREHRGGTHGQVRLGPHPSAQPESRGDGRLLRAHVRRRGHPHHAAGQAAHRPQGRRRQRVHHRGAARRQDRIPRRGPPIRGSTTSGCR